MIFSFRQGQNRTALVGSYKKYLTGVQFYFRQLSKGKGIPPEILQGLSLISVEKR